MLVWLGGLVLVAVVVQWVMTRERKRRVAEARRQDRAEWHARRRRRQAARTKAKSI